MPGKYYEELQVGEILEHRHGRTLTEMDNVLFSSLTMNPQPLHINEDFASRTQFGQRIVNGIFSLGLAVGITVGDLTDGTLVANLGYDNVRHTHPLFHGDTVYVSTEILSKRDSKSRADRGIVAFKHVVRNQKGTTVLEFERTAMMLKRSSVSE